MGNLTVGVIGMGKMGLLHASIVNTLPGVRLSAIYEKNTRMVNFTEKAFTDVCVTSDFEKFADLHLDVVYITTPIPTHFSIIKDIYSRGISKNLFVEKTLASNYKQAAQLCDEARTANGTTMVGYMSRFAPTFKKAKALLEEDVIGKVISFKAYAYASDFIGVKRKSLPGKGGATKDLGAHVIDLCLWFFGDMEIELSKLESQALKNDESSAFFNTIGVDGLKGEFDISWCKEGYRLPEFGIMVTGSTGTFKVNADFVKLEKSGADAVTWHRHDLDSDLPFFLGGAEYYLENTHFIKSVLEGSIAVPDFNTAAKVDFLIDRLNAKIGAQE